ncbi:MAG: hypothetical protein D6788_02730, partial [Planctomycetota bacterium]
MVETAVLPAGGHGGEGVAAFFSGILGVVLEGGCKMRPIWRLMLGWLGTGGGWSFAVAQERSLSPPACETVFDPIDASGNPTDTGDWANPANWTNGVPRPDTVACFLSQAAADRFRREAGWTERVRVVKAIPRAPTGGDAGRRDEEEAEAAAVQGRSARRAVVPIVIHPSRLARWQTQRGGSPAGAGGGVSVVYRNEIASVAAIRAPGAGERMADDLILASGPTTLVSYEFAVFGLGTSGTPTFDVSASLWTDNPCLAGSAVIPGTPAEFSAIPNDNQTVWILQVELAQPVLVPGTVWLALTFSTDDAGWVVAEEAETGRTEDFWSEDDAQLGCVLFQFSDPLFAGFWATLSAPLGTSVIGACCVGSTCLVTDAFDCKIQRGYFQPNVVSCTQATCGTGVCCTPVQDVGEVGCNDGGGWMDEPTCAAIGGQYIGGAVCDETDACQRFRIPEGFEIVEAAAPLLGLRHRPPRLNDCGEIVFFVDMETPFGLRGVVFRADNGRLEQITHTEEEGISNIFPDINDQGVIVWSRPWGEEPARVVRWRNGDLQLITHDDLSMAHRSPRINNAGHVVWDTWHLDTCPLRMSIHFFDAYSTRTLFDDGRTNASEAINDRDQVVWVAVTPPCPDGPNWTSVPLLYDQGQ